MAGSNVDAPGFRVQPPPHPGVSRVLTDDAREFLIKLHRRFDARRRELLAARAARQKRIDQGEKPDFLPETRHVRESAWTVAPNPRDLLDRRVEITGPVDRKMIINALNSGAKVFMAKLRRVSNRAGRQSAAPGRKSGGEESLRHFLSRHAAFRSISAVLVRECPTIHPEWSGRERHF